MKVIAVNASHRGSRGITALLTERIGRGVQAAGGEYETITLSKLKITRCLACSQCQQGGDRFLHCVHEQRDDAVGVFDSIRTSDIVIYATPIYLMTMSSALKLLLERMYGTMNCADMQLSNAGLIHHHIDPTLSSKPFVTLVTYANFEDEMGRSVIEYFRTFARFMNAPQVGVLVRNASPLLESEGTSYHARIAAVLDAYEQSGRDLVQHRRIRAVTQRRANQELIPLPLFRYLRHLKPIKRRILAQTQAFYAETFSQAESNHSSIK